MDLRFPACVGVLPSLTSPSQRIGRYEKALEEAREELHLDQNNGVIYSDLATSYLNLNRLAEADAVLKQADERKIESGELLGSRYQLALLRGDAGQMER